MPLPNHENILMFYAKQPTYNAQTYNGEKSHSMGKTANTQSKTKVYGDFVRKENTDDVKQPKTVLYYQQPFPQIHNTQKPIELCDYQHTQTKMNWCWTIQWEAEQRELPV